MGPAGFGAEPFLMTPHKRPGDARSPPPFPVQHVKSGLGLLFDCIFDLVSMPHTVYKLRGATTFSSLRSPLRIPSFLWAQGGCFGDIC